MLLSLGSIIVDDLVSSPADCFGPDVELIIVKDSVPSLECSMTSNGSDFDSS